jgi:hypothetical protein
VEEVGTIGLDTANNVFHAHGADAREAAVQSLDHAREGRRAAL